jgi:choline monooxygenase
MIPCAMGAGPPGAERASQELERFDCDAPIAAAATPPKSWYVEPAFLELERAKVFARTWQYACPLDLLREPGDFARVDLLGETYVVLRNAQGELRGFHNVCRHHAAELLAGTGCVQEIVCPYHGWTYDLDGRLARAPRMGALQGFTREGFSLSRVAVEAWGPLVFLHPGSPQRSVREELSELEQRLQSFGMDGLRHVTRRTYPMRCNWKVFVDNYLDGGYHIAHLHGGLASQLELGAYRTECFERSSIQTCPGGAEASFRGQDFRERIGQGALYAWIYPNLMLNRYGPILDINWVRPLAADRCEVVFDYWYPESQRSDGFVEASLAASDAVQQEDVGISESVQRGLGSSSYDQGRYAPSVEMAMHHFHRLLARDLRG